MFCINCGKKIIEGEKFCMACGAPVVADETEKLDTPPIESKKELVEEPKAAEIPKASAELSVTVKAQEAAEPYDEEARSFGRSGAIAALVFGAIAFLGMFINFGIIMGIMEEMF